MLSLSRNVGGRQQDDEEVEVQHDKSNLGEEDLHEEGLKNQQLGYDGPMFELD